MAPAATPPAGTDYVLQRQTWDSGGLVQGWTTIYGPGTATAFTTTDQTCGETYNYQVQAVNGAGVVTAFDSQGPFQNAPCTGSVSVTAGSATSLNVNWPLSSPPNTPGTRYTVLDQAASGGSYTYLAEGGNTTSAVITGLQPNTQYYVWLGGNTGWWDGGSIAYTDANPPGPPSVTTVAQTAMSIAWSPNGNAAGTLYQTYLEPASGGPGVDWQTTGNSFATFGSLLCGVQYTPYVQAQQGGGGAWSAWVSGAATPTVPCAPVLAGGDGGLGWSPSSGRGYVILSWPYLLRTPLAERAKKSLDRGCGPW